LIYRADTIYHIYNQGNNRQQIFFSSSNYEYFKTKLARYIKPTADILAYCLMPNHFHLLLRINSYGLERISSSADQNNAVNMQRFSFQLAILLRSYTSAINKQENRSGSLFRQHTKSKVVKSSSKFFDPENNALIDIPEYANYYKTCINYIHSNPVRSGLISRPSEWIYSSYLSYHNQNRDRLCNTDLSRQLCFDTEYL
jgi:putative transposase